MPNYLAHMRAYGTPVRYIDDRSAMGKSVTSHQSTDEAVEFQPEMSINKQEHMIFDSSSKEKNQSEWNPTAIVDLWNKAFAPTPTLTNSRSASIPHSTISSPGNRDLRRGVDDTILWTPLDESRIGSRRVLIEVPMGSGFHNLPLL
ncbi:hypothetical protein N7G274_003875 [Stereocaulon virgatum]|uniref:Uncharacterized protein n=1 Tax=Stereocaulon virgatum TaxID=373712 RepID=A0ABR4AJH6_9LECA